MALEVFFLGPLTDLQGVEEPDSFDRSPTRIQSVFQGATGRVSANTTGVKRTWQLSWDRALPGLRTRLESFYLGLGSGDPLRFVDPYGVNLLDPRTASAGTTYGTRPLFSTLASGLTATLQAGTGIPVTPAPRLMTRLVSSGGTALEASAGWAGLVAPNLGGPVTLSAWVKAPSGGTLKLYSSTGDSEALFNGTVASASIPSGSSWVRVSCTGTAAAGSFGLYPAISVPAGATVNVGPLQLERASDATTWTPGVGGQVVVSSFSDAVSLFPYSELAIELLEA